MKKAIIVVTWVLVCGCEPILLEPEVPYLKSNEIDTTQTDTIGININNAFPDFSDTIININQMALLVKDYEYIWSHNLYDELIWLANKEAVVSILPNLINHLKKYKIGGVQNP